jgi:metallo-beta-lactamase family protein
MSIKRAAPRDGGPTLTALGAAGEVTGSCYLVETGGTRFLIDCGMFQGGKPAARKNREFHFNPKRIDFVVLSHAHLDHSGLLPRLTARGFSGPVYATPATADLLAVLLTDSAHLQERDAERESRDHKRASRPLYTTAEALACLKQIKTVRYGEDFHPSANVSCTLRDAGHILGSAIVEARIRQEAGREHRLVFSGDLGPRDHPIVRDPAVIEEADTLLIESTYGDRLHKNCAQTLDEFAYALTDTLKSREGNVVIPAFAVGRTQDILYYIAKLAREGRLPAMRIFVDSPMALSATRTVMRHPEVHDRDTSCLRDLLAGKINGFRVELVADVEQSRRINAIRSGAVIISASGMCEGGRIRHHLEHNLSRPECSIVFAGFQAMGTLGRHIVDGAKSVRLFGAQCPVRARIFTIGGLSAHADQAGLLSWLAQFKRPPGQTWVVHGEPLAAETLRAKIAAMPGWSAALPTAQTPISF